MERAVAQAIVDACQNNWVEAEIYEEYSGRGMYGKTTTGISIEGSISSVLQAVLKSLSDLSEQEEDGVDFSSVSIRSDSLGMGMILY